MIRIKRFHKTKRDALKYIETLGNFDKKSYHAYKSPCGKYWVGTELEWLNK